MWKPIHGDDEGFNAGNNEPGVGGAIEDSLLAAMRATPRDSPAWKELDRRFDWLQPRVGGMVYSPMSDWWDGPYTVHKDPSVSTS